MTVLTRAMDQPHPAVLEEEMPIRWGGQDDTARKTLSVLRMAGREPASSRQDAGQHAGPGRWDVEHNEHRRREIRRE
jgi:hypothetical protein